VDNLTQNETALLREIAHSYKMPGYPDVLRRDGAELLLRIADRADAQRAVREESPRSYREPTENLPRIPPGWKIERRDSKPFLVLRITAPNGYSAIVHSHERNPANVL
jgi:hypothetical protein